MEGNSLTGNRVLVEEAFDRLSVTEVRSNDFRDIGQGDMGIKDTFRLDDGNRALFAEPMTAGEIYFNAAQDLFRYGFG
jgi:hypothetical protein